MRNIEEKESKEVSREKKLELCKKAYDRIFNYSGPDVYKIQFICVAIETFLPHYEDKKKEVKAYQAIPELLEYKPKDRKPNNHWFTIDEEGMEKRKSILLELIKRFENG